MFAFGLGCIAFGFVLLFVCCSIMERGIRDED